MGIFKYESAVPPVMLADISEIRILRKQNNLTQSQLARLSGVSQSLIAKLEAGLIDPSYGNFRKIHDVLNGLREEKEPKAGDVSSSRIISARRENSLVDAVRKMKRHGISQLPVMDGVNVVGLLAEKNVIEIVHQGRDVRKLRVEGAMGDAPPAVPVKTPLRIVTELLRVSPLVVVTRNGKPSGVVSKADILNRLAR